MAIRLYWLWRKGWDYAQVKKFGSQDSPKQAMMFRRTSSNGLWRPAPLYGGVEVVIMIAVATEEMHGSDRVPDLNDYDASLAWIRHLSSRAKWRSCASACRSVVGKQLDTADIVREACSRQNQTDYAKSNGALRKKSERTVHSSSSPKH